MSELLDGVQMRLSDKARQYREAEITGPQIGMLNGTLAEKVGSNWRRPVLEMLWDVTSSKDLTLGQASATIDWLLSEDFEQEWVKLWREHLLDQGQLTMAGF